MRIEDITAVLVTRGDVDLSPVFSTLRYPEIVVWNNAEREQRWAAGRIGAMLEASTDVCFSQDDDVIVPPATHAALVAAYQPGVAICNWGHGRFAAGFDDVGFTGAGAIFDRRLAIEAFDRYLDHFGPFNQEAGMEADFAIGVLMPHRHVHLPYEIRPEARRPNRLCNTPGHLEQRMRVTNRARWIRDHASGAPSTTVTLPARWAARAKEDAA